MLTDLFRERVRYLLNLIQSNVPTLNDAIDEPCDATIQRAREAASAIEVAAWDVQQCEGEQKWTPTTMTTSSATTAAVD